MNTQKNTKTINDFIFNDNDLIEIIINDAKNKFKQSGLYKDAYIIKEYIANRGTFDKETTEHPYFKKIVVFLAENWVDVMKFLEDHHITDLTELQHAQIVRPLLRINDDTPITINELLKLHSKKKLLELCNNKITNNSNINWKSGKIYIKKII